MNAFSLNESRISQLSTEPIGCIYRDVYFTEAATTTRGLNARDALLVSWRESALGHQCFNPEESKTQHGVKALVGGDAQAADAVELRGLQVLDDFFARLSFGFLHEA